MTTQPSALSDQHSAAPTAAPARPSNTSSPQSSVFGPRSSAPVRRPRLSTLGLRPSTRSSAFTLLELLTVIAVIGILAAIIFPSIGAARKSANRAKTKVQFNQWAAAIESFRSEYGYYPAFHTENRVNPSAQSTNGQDVHLFHDILAARRRDGSQLPAYSSSTNPQMPEVQNRKRIAFYSFNESEISASNLIIDAFGNTSIAVLVDRNLDGRIDTNDYTGGYPLVTLPDGTTATPSTNGGSPDIPPTGIRAGVVFYAADPNATSGDPQFIFSWK